MRRPVFKVTSAILSPFPSAPIRFSRGTRTSWKLMMPLASALRPMKRQRCSTFTPGQSVSTMKQLIFFVLGSRAITTSSSAMVPFVHQSFSPLRTNVSPCSSAVVDRLAGSEPTCGSVRAKAEMAPAAHRGRYFFFCSGVPKSLSGCGTPIDWCAERSALMFES